MLRGFTLFFLILLLVIVFLQYSYNVVYADYVSSVDVVVGGNTYRGIKIKCNTSVLSVGGIPNGLKIIVNETPAEIILYINASLQVERVKGDVAHYNIVASNDRVNAIEIIVPKTSGLAEVEVVFKNPSWSPRISLMTIMEIAFIVIVIISIITVAAKYK